MQSQKSQQLQAPSSGGWNSQGSNYCRERSHAPLGKPVVFQTPEAFPIAPSGLRIILPPHTRAGAQGFLKASPWELGDEKHPSCLPPKVLTPIEHPCALYGSGPAPSVCPSFSSFPTSVQQLGHLHGVASGRHLTLASFALSPGPLPITSHRPPLGCLAGIPVSTLGALSSPGVSGLVLEVVSDSFVTHSL